MDTGRTIIRTMGAIALLLLATGCSRTPGQDAIYPYDAYTKGSVGDDCETCHIDAGNDSINPLLTGGSGGDGKHVIHYSTKGFACSLCHSGYTSATTHFDGTLDSTNAAINIVIFNSSVPAGTWVNDVGPKTGQCSGITCHGSAPLDWYGTAGWSMPPCVDCHLAPGNDAINPVVTGGSGTDGKHQQHVGTGAFDCEKCHLGYATATSHVNGSFDGRNQLVNTMTFDSTNPSGIWNNPTGECYSMDCHGPDTVEWYGVAGWTLLPCIDCHSTQRGIRRAVTGAIGNFGGNASVVSKHIATAGDPTEAQCQICHEMTKHMGGTVRLPDMDSGAIINVSALSDAEAFCLSCHDTDGANGNMSPFADGQTLGAGNYNQSVQIKANWNKTYGHKNADLGLTCVGTGEPNTGCHMNGHGSEFNGVLAKRLTMPPPNYGGWNSGPFQAPAEETDYDICFSCHANYSAIRPEITKEGIFGVQAGGNFDWDHYWWDWTTWASIYPPYNVPNILTRFRDTNRSTALIYDDANLWGAYLNLHYFHMEDEPQWYYRGTIQSGTSCITCHNMHGTNTQYGYMHDEFELQHFTGSGSDEYATINRNNLYSQPINCNSWFFPCHTQSDFSNLHFWYEPAVE